LNSLPTSAPDGAARDPLSDGLLHGAIVAALALAQRKQPLANKGDIKALSGAAQLLLKELERFGKIDKFAENIQRDAGKISDELRKTRKAIERTISNTQAALEALEVELRDEQAESASPIRVDAPVARTTEDASRDESQADSGSPAQASAPAEDPFGWLDDFDDDVDAAEE
jgi:hypothetical protein